MEEIIVMNDASVEALHAAEYAFNLACLYNKSIIIANLSHVQSSKLERLPIANFQAYGDDEERNVDLVDHLSSLKLCTDFQPQVRQLDFSSFAERELVQFINSQRIWMLVQGVTGEGLSSSRLILQSVLNRIQCPILLVPVDTPVRPLERLAYLADLRYAQVPVINFLARMKNGSESVILAHICAQGLPELDNSYAMDLFSNGLNKNVCCDHLFFSRLKEKSFTACIDQVLHGMQADLLVCVNHHYHFEQLLAGNIDSPMPAELNVPVLVFPH